MSEVGGQIETKGKTRSFRYAVKVEHVISRNIMLVHVPGSALVEPDVTATSGTPGTSTPLPDRPVRVTPIAEHQTVETKTVETIGDTKKPFLETKTKETTTIKTKELGSKPTTETTSLMTVVTEPNENIPQPQQEVTKDTEVDPGGGQKAAIQEDEAGNTDQQEVVPDIVPVTSPEVTSPGITSSHHPLHCRHSSDPRNLATKGGSVEGKYGVPRATTLPLMGKTPVRRMGKDYGRPLAAGRPRRPTRSSLDSKLSEMYVKRDAGWRHSPVVEPPVMHRRSSLRPPRVLVRNEPHPMAATFTEEDYDLDDDLDNNVFNMAPEENQRPQYDRQFSQRSKKVSSADDSSLGDTSPHGTLTDLDRQKIRLHKPSSKISTLFSPFGKGLGEKQEQLNELLNSYSLNGLPAMPELLTIGQGQYDPDLLDIENHWTDVVDGAETMTKKEKEQQMRLWELLRTEVEYIKRLKVITDLFMCCLINLQNETLLNEIETERVFSNIMDVHNVNCQLWEEHMSLVLRHSRQTKEPLNPSLMKSGFVKLEELFTPYTMYCLEQEGCQEYIKNRCRDNELFKTFVIWAEAQNQCNRLKLADLVVTPMQRITRYKLLLAAILKETQEEQQRADLKIMIEHVESFVNQVNTAMHQRQEQARLSTIIDRIEAYDVIDTPNDESAKLVSEFCRLDLTCPVPGCGPKQKRHLLREGGLKMKETANKMDVFCFLFTDMILVTKVNRKSQDKDKVKVIKPPMRLDKVVVHNLRDGVSFLLVYLNEYHLASAVYTFSGDAKPWVDSIRKAQDDYKVMRQTSLQRPESRLIGYDGSEDNDDDSAVFNAGRHEYSPESTFFRLDSTGSVDGFMPTLTSPFHGQDEPGVDVGDDDRLRRLRPQSSADTVRPRSPRLQSIPVRRTTSSEDSIQEEGNGNFLMINAENKWQTPSPATPELIRAGEDGGFITYQSRPRSACIRSDSGSSGEAGSYPTSQKYFLGQRSQDYGFMDETMKVRLANQRRRPGPEKRYHTADAIREMTNKDKDATIHKRLSWNFPVNINLEDERHSILKQKTFSSDSLRSVPSSSGVSSTGSLHLSPDSELPEGYEIDSIAVSRKSSQTDQLQGDESPSVMARQAEHPPADSRAEHIGDGRVVSIEEENEALAQLNQMSKSMPDISNINENQAEDGSKSPGRGSPQQGGQRRRMTHAQLLRIKKMMLLNSTLEASEV